MRKWRRLFFLAAAVCLCFLFFFRYAQYDRVMSMQEDGSSAQITAVVTAKQVKTNSVQYTLSDVHYTQPELSDCRHGVVYYSDDSIPIGSRVNFTGELSELSHASNEGGFDSYLYYKSYDIRIVLFADSAEVLYIPRWRLREFLYQLRKKASAFYAERLSEDHAGILSAMTLGDKSGLDAESRLAYQKQGIAHILAISGLHISLIGMSIYKLLRRFLHAYPISAAVSMTAVFLFAMMSGMSVSTRRAVVMYGFFLGAQICGRGYETGLAMAYSAIILLFCQPLALLQSGFLLSYSAIASILWIEPGVRRFLSDEKLEKIRDCLYAGIHAPPRLENGLRSLWSSFCLCLALWIGMFPLTAWFFYAVPTYSFLLNLIIVPLCPYLLAFGLGGSLLGLFLPKVGAALLYPADEILRLYDFLMTLTGKLPQAQRITGRPSVFLIIIFYSLMFLIPLFRMAFPRTDLRRICAGGAAAILCAVWIAPARSEFRVDFLDVGQGDGICISTSDKTHIFIDGGSSSESSVGLYDILPYLKIRRIRSIDAWIVTHADSDHISGVLEILRSGYPVKELWIAQAADFEDENLQELIAAATENGTAVVTVSAGDAVETSDFSMCMLYPKTSEDIADKNELSQVWRLTTVNDYAILFTGDLGSEQESVLEERGLLSDIDLLKVGHHGSKNSSSAAFLEAIKPETAVISVGENNLYGHPSDETVDRLTAVGADIYTTMDCGQITLRVSDGTYTLEAYGK